MFHEMLALNSLLFLTVVLFENGMSEIVKDNRSADVSVEASPVLSRRKRFLTFPEGSSLQLVFCVQTAALIPIGDIFLYGNTAALAWNLPSDTMFFNDLKQKERAQRRGDSKKIGYLDEKGRVIAKVPYTSLGTEALIPIGDVFLYGNTAALAWNLPSDTMFFNDLKQKERAQRRGDSKKIRYLDEKGRVIAKVPYTRRPIINPAFAKRSINEDQLSFKEKLKLKINRMKMHEKQSQREYLNRDNLDKKSIEFHRSSRLELFRKIETLLTALGKDGRQCVLYKLCESAQRTGQGSFMQEFLRAVFTLPKGNNLDENNHKEYDQAHTSSEGCLSRYPGCIMEASPQL